MWQWATNLAADAMQPHKLATTMFKHWWLVGVNMLPYCVANSMTLCKMRVEEAETVDRYYLPAWVLPLTADAACDTEYACYQLPNLLSCTIASTALLQGMVHKCQQALQL